MIGYAHIPSHDRESGKASTADKTLVALVDGLMREAREDGLVDYADADEPFSADTFRARSALLGHVERLRTDA